jgi:peptidoglycan hydrolase-like protein with peptidoglycan-binding domain
MKRAVYILAAAALACASQQKTSSTETSAASRAGEDQASVVQPSSLSPEQVRLVQRSLIDRGFAVDLSGSFDQPTQTALTEFQRARGLPATGNLNAPTVDALGLDPRDVMPVRGPSGAVRTPAQTGGSYPTTPPGSNPTYGASPDSSSNHGTTGSSSAPSVPDDTNTRPGDITPSTPPGSPRTPTGR